MNSKMINMCYLFAFYTASAQNSIF